MAAEGREADISLAAWPEADSRCTNHVGIVEHLLEKPPTVLTFGRFQPNIGGIFSAEHLQARLVNVLRIVRALSM